MLRAERLNSSFGEGVTNRGELVESRGSFNGDFYADFSKMSAPLNGEERFKGVSLSGEAAILLKR